MFEWGLSVPETVRLVNIANCWSHVILLVAVRFSRDTLLNVAAAPQGVTKVSSLGKKNYPPWNTIRVQFMLATAAAYSVTNSPPVENYSPWTILPWNLPSAGGATAGIPYTSSTVKNSCLKIVVVTLCALLTRNVFAAATFLVFVLHFSFFIQFFAFSISFLCSVCCCTLTVYVCCHSFVLNFLLENSQMSTT